MFKIGTFYKCFEFPKYQELEDGLRDHCIKRHIKGTIILTPEGINATISSNKDKALEDLNLYLNNLVGEVVFRFSYSNKSPFKRLKIKTRKELVPSGTNGKSYNHKGKYLTPSEWHNFIQDSKNIVIDVRNDYENKVGTFRNSISPDTKNFREFKYFLKKNKKKLKDKNIVDVITPAQLVAINGRNEVESIDLKVNEEIVTIETDFIIPLYGLIPKMNIFKNWGLNIEKNAISVNNALDYSTNIKGIYAIGDICAYPGKLKLILSGFHEGALAARACFKLARPNEKYRFEFTTTSTNLLKRLGKKE